MWSKTKQRRLLRTCINGRTDKRFRSKGVIVIAFLTAESRIPIILLDNDTVAKHEASVKDRLIKDVGYQLSEKIYNASQNENLTFTVSNVALEEYVDNLNHVKIFRLSLMYEQSQQCDAVCVTEACPPSLPPIRTTQPRRISIPTPQPMVQRAGNTMAVGRAHDWPGELASTAYPRCREDDNRADALNYAMSSAVNSRHIQEGLQNVRSVSVQETDYGQNQGIQFNLEPRLIYPEGGD